MKKVILLSILLSFITLSSFAQHKYMYTVKITTEKYEKWEHSSGHIIIGEKLVDKSTKTETDMVDDAESISDAKTKAYNSCSKSWCGRSGWSNTFESKKIDGDTYYRWVKDETRVTVLTAWKL